MFRVEVGLVLQGRDGTMGLSRRLRLPFAPFPGLELGGLSADPDCPETVAAVSFDVRERVFRVELLDRSSGEEPLARLIDSYGPAWQLHEPGEEPLLDT